jgi:CDP-diacylglycerol--glycerol-3-phosphate 3-phosphatidyltransferase
MSVIRHLPNAITIGRGLAGPVGAFILLASFSAGMASDEAGAVGYGLAAFIILVLAALTDALDGWIARLLNAESALGELLDPIADKLLVGSYLVAFVVIYRFDLMLMIPVAIILTRDLTVTGLRLTSDTPSAMAATDTAKAKTALQMVLVMAPFIVVMLGPHPDDRMALYSVFWISAVWVLAAMTVWSAIPYWRARKRPSDEA